MSLIKPGNSPEQTSQVTIEDLTEAFQRIATAVETTDLEAYEGDEYFVHAWAGGDHSYEEAIEFAQHPFVLYVILLHGLEYVLADRHVAVAMRRHLSNGAVRSALGDWLRNSKRKRKPGPRPRMKGYLSTQAFDLHELGWSYGKIAKLFYKDREKANRAAALVSQEKKRRANLKDQ